MNRKNGTLYLIGMGVLFVVLSFGPVNAQPADGSRGVLLTLINGGQTDTSFFGIHPLATKCIDGALGEHDLPIDPPCRCDWLAFDEWACNDHFQLRYDLHPAPVTVSLVDTFKLKAQVADEGDTNTTIRWPGGVLSGLADSIKMVGGGFSVNMLKDSVFRWNPNGDEVLSIRIFVTWKVASNPPPVITTFWPPGGEVGWIVRIRGYHFRSVQGNSSVRFGYVSAPVDTWSDTLIVVKVPNKVVGAYPIFVTVGNTTIATNQFFVVPIKPSNLIGASVTLSNGGQTDVSFMGIYPGATKCIDFFLDELEYPPAPETTTFATFRENECLGGGLKYDLHPPTSTDTFKLEWTLLDNTSPAKLAWSSGLLALYANSAVASGCGFAIDMLRDSLFVWNPDSASLSGMAFCVNWKSIPPKSGYPDVVPGFVRLTLMNASRVDTSTFGAVLNATSCIDAAVGEEEVPPFPPPGVLFSAFVEKTCLGNGLKFDGHRRQLWLSTLDTFKLKIQLADSVESYATISWDMKNLERTATSARIFGGTGMADMLRESEFLWYPDDTPIRSVKIIVEWRSEYIENVKRRGDQLSDFTLNQNYPNPFNPSTVITYQLPEQAIVHLSVYNVLGQEVRVLTNSVQEAGEKSVTFDATGLTSGIYFYRIEATSISDPAKRFYESRKLMLVK